MLKQTKATLPFSDTQDLEEQKKGLIAPMKELQIKSDRGGVAWDVERFQFFAVAGRLRQYPSFAAAPGSN